jgi:putative redox protein
MIKLSKDDSGALRQKITIATHQLMSDVDALLGGEGSAPDPHDLFDASLAACTAITLSMFAKRRGIPLEAVNIELDRDSSREKSGDYSLDLAIEFVGEITPEQEAQLLAIVDKCPIHKLMSHGNIQINTRQLG